jgi:hypothetical protein
MTHMPSKTSPPLPGLVHVGAGLIGVRHSWAAVAHCVRLMQGIPMNCAISGGFVH